MPLIRNFLEAHQIFIYICAVVLAGGVALLVSAASVLEAAVNPALALMLYVTFLQVPVAELRGGFGQGLS